MNKLSPPVQYNASWLKTELLSRGVLIKRFYFEHEGRKFFLDEIMDAARTPDGVIIYFVNESLFLNEEQAFHLWNELDKLAEEILEFTYAS